MFNYLRKSLIYLLGGYDAAERTPENRKHWAKVPKDFIPSLNNTPEVRRRLRLNAQYEWMNNCYCTGMISSLARDTIGIVGPKLQMMTPDKDVNSLIESKWRKWSESPEVLLMEKLFTMDQSRRLDGESFPILIQDTSTVEDREKLNVTVIAARRITNLRYSYPMQEGDIVHDDGVNYNIKTGRPESFDITINPIDTIQSQEVTTVSATHMKQWFLPRQPEQIRGVCEIAAGLPLFAFLRRYTLAVLSNAEFAASMTGVMETAAPPGADTTQVPEYTEIPFVRGTLLSLPEGWKAQGFKGEQPTNTYPQFVDCVLREIGRALDIPFGIVAGDSSKYNYSSARLDYRGYDDRVSFDRKCMVIRVVNPVFNEWLKEFLVSRKDILRLIESNDTYHNWRFSSRAAIDPLKEARADEVRLKTLTKTLAEVYGERGLDWEEELEQREKETKRLRELGITPPAETMSPADQAEIDALASEGA